MRHIRFIRRRDIGILNALFFASAFLFYEMHTTLIFKEFVERRLEEIFPKGTHIDIGHIEGGIFRDITSENVRIFSDQHPSGFTIEHIELNHRLWYPILKKIPALSHRFDEKKIILLIGRDGEGLLKGFFELEGTPERLNVSGYLGEKRQGRIFIKGVVERGKPSMFHITLNKGTIDLKIEKREKKYFVRGYVNHVVIQGIDCVGLCSATVETNDKDIVQGKISFSNLIINYLPFDKSIEFILGFDNAKEIMHITSFRVGDDIEGYGQLRLSKPHYIFLKWSVIDLDLREYFRTKNISKSMTGIMNGSFTLKGPIKEAGLRAHLDIQDGYLGDLKFDSMIVNLEGKGPLISLGDSRIRKEGGYIHIGGEIDLSKLGSREAFDGVFYGPGKNFFVWDGWSVTRSFRDLSVTVEKTLDEGTGLNVKARSEDTKTGEEHFFGVEHKVKF